MSITPSFLQNKWADISFRAGGFVRLDASHPLEWHIGYQPNNRQTLVIVCSTKIDTVASSKSMTVTLRRRETDNRWALSFELMQLSKKEVFSVFCSDIIEHSRGATNEKIALVFVVNRYKQWSRLLESQKVGLLDERSRKGLLGELLFLKQRLESTESFLSAVQGWSGAEGGDQDFIYSEGWYEIKSLGASATTVTISSMEQLACMDDGELVIIRIDKTVPEQANAISLNDVVQQLTVKLLESSEALEVFQSKLVAYGYLDLHDYSEQKYCWSGTQQYKVDSTFPRLVRQSVPTQIVSLSYELSLSAIRKWQTR